MIPIGGYFEMELPKGEEYHKEAIRLNTGRNAFEYILRAKGYKKVFLPYYTCDVMIEPIKRLRLEYEFYHINKQLEPIFDYTKISEDETFVYTNYFGIMGKIVKKLSNICQNLIIDNSQAFFETPITDIDTFYSPRKFFGLPDGGYLYTCSSLNIEFEKDSSWERCNHLLRKIENGVEETYSQFVANEMSLIGESIKSMSNITLNLLKGIDYNKIAIRRRINFDYLHAAIGSLNGLNINNENYFVPMIYPFLVEKQGIRNYLIKNKVFVAQYWPNVLKWCKEGSIESKLTQNILSLPIDQRYNEMHMQRIVDLIFKYV